MGLLLGTTFGFSNVAHKPPLVAPDPTEFLPGGEFTVGAEEELLLVDRDGHLLQSGQDRVIQKVVSQLQTGGIISKELFRSEIEFGTVVCRGAEHVAGSLAALRGALRRAGGFAIGAGLHPEGPFGQVELTPSARYDAVSANLAGVIRTPTAALQVHVGLPDVDTAITAFRGLRGHLPLFRALAAASPYWHGQDSGLASARWAVLQSYPRGGVPPVLRTWEEYVRLTEALLTAADIPDYTQIWWDLRLQPRLGTVEVRTMDAQPSLEAVAGITALIQGLARDAVENPPSTDLPTEVLAENDFRAARYGLDATIVDPSGVLRPIRELVAEAVTRARAVLGGDRLDAPLSAVEKVLTDEPEYARQRRLRAELGAQALLKDLVTRTMTG